MNNRLLVPEMSMSQMLKDVVINPKKVALSSIWWTAPVVISVIVGAIVAQIFCRITGDDSILASALFADAFYIGCIFAILEFRKKIIADMKTAGNFKGTFGFYCNENFKGLSLLDVPTMAGKLTYECDGSTVGLVQKKTGRYFDYYDYSDVCLGQKDLRIFIAGKSPLDIVPNSILGTCQ